MSNLYGTFSEYKKITLTWENINVNKPIQSGGFLSKFKKKAAPVRSHIIQDVKGIARPGQVIAIMGASGAGKTTLLNVLTCRSSGDLRMTGDVKVNGKIILDPSEISSVSGYVQQDDLFIATMKVKEHLTFQAMLRLDNSNSNAQKEKRVEEVLNDLNLKKCENTLIGDPSRGEKGISGGERRRLAFASEIITDPGLLFCDEPTSGLDSFMAMTIVESMKHLAEKGKTIVCTIHQPSSEIFECFDSLYLMAEGRLAFSGSLNNAVEFFTSQGHVCPENYNPADFYINKLAISPFDKENCKKTVKAICNGFENSMFNEQLKNEVVNVEKNYSKEKQTVEKSKKYKVSGLTQFWWLMWRNFLSSSRDPRETRINLVQTIAFAVLFGFIYFRLDLDQTGVQNINGVLFLLVTNNTFSNLFPVLTTFPLLIPIFLREHKNGMYRVFNFYFSKTLIDLPRFIIMPFIFTTIVYWMCNLNHDPVKYLICCATVVLVANVTTAFGSLISAIAPNINIALAISGPLLTPIMIFGGFFLNSDSIPVYFVWIKYISWLNYSNQIVLINQWDGVDSIPCQNGTACIYRNGNDVLEKVGVNKDDFYLNFALLGVLIVAYRLLAFLVLLLKSRRK